MNIEELLNQGRAILAEKKRSKDVETCELWLALDDAFSRARADAVKSFAPLDEAMVQPKKRYDDWNPDFSREGRRLTFSIRPFVNAGTISVKLDGHCSDNQWHWQPADDRSTFYVAYDFQAYEDGTGASGRSFHTTNSLPEALALCEKEGEAYREIVKYGKERAETRAKKAAQFKPEPTPGEFLLQALDRWLEDRLAALDIQGNG